MANFLVHLGFYLGFFTAPFCYITALCMPLFECPTDLEHTVQYVQYVRYVSYVFFWGIGRTVSYKR